MSDPLTEVVNLLQPQAVFANAITGRGEWAVRYSKYGQPSFCIMLEGSCRLAVDGHEVVTISAGDFVFLPTTPSFTLSSCAEALPILLDPRSVGGDAGELRYGEQSGEPEMRSLGGAFMFGSASPQLLISLLPRVVHVQGSRRLAALVAMVGDEYASRMPGAEFMLSRLAGMMLIEAMRSCAVDSAPPGLLRGLGDKRLSAALHAMHAEVGRPWTIAQLANAAALSRSVFFDRFTRAVGAPPMEYLLGWRMEIAKHLLRDERMTVGEVAERVGYASTSTFSTAFSRHFGVPPLRYARST